MIIGTAWLAGTAVPGLGKILSLWSSSNSGTKQSIVIFGALFLVTLGVFIWAAFFRKQARHRHSHSHRHDPAPAAESTAQKSGADAQDGDSSGRRRRRRRRRREAPRNPTLAETGGLPPVRPEGPEPPGSLS